MRSLFTSQKMSGISLSSAHQERATFAERHAWKVMLALSITIILFGIGDMVGGGSDLQSGESVLMHSITRTGWNELKEASPYVANMIDYNRRIGGAQLFGIGILSALVCLVPFRRGERWAWYAQWVFPFLMAAIVLFLGLTDRAPGSQLPVPMILGSIFFVVAMLALVLSARKFFRTANPGVR
ncbi:MAG: hypothetical protein M3014_07140 [Chloroflexota bacterium]|nr:hypothetical protein [Chloroflexota bacterium]